MTGKRFGTGLIKNGAREPAAGEDIREMPFCRTLLTF
jgi:hypothetical protein